MAKVQPHRYFSLSESKKVHSGEAHNTEEEKKTKSYFCCEYKK
jgi:hypothetical protein